ncbi:Fucose 4-O-acetylase [Andreprevotia lacus DSM 23236]|uniref:Fucose 4-O-acetylase n=2 Tax=Andreprevotia TaxID=397275 RepID=A0A1W1XRA6_9NEIS|nr:Fucose 4-O-acetylase [Andreprevotia lacus DSM 23236]
MRNAQFDLMLAIGIIFVLMGHSHQPAFLFYPAYSFHMGLFFFISGYFFKPQSTLAGKWQFLRRKAQTQLLPYYALLLLFGVITLLLRHVGINVGSDMNADSLLWGPFGRADQFNLYLSAWFLLTLFLVNVAAGALYSGQRQADLFILAGGTVLLYFMLDLGKQNVGDWRLQAIRSSFGFFFFGLGYFFRLYEAQIKPLLLRPAAVICLFVLTNMLIVHFGNIGYSILLGNIGNDLVWVPIVGTLAIILQVYVLAHHLAQVSSEQSWLLLIGRNTFAIMIWHFAAFLLLNVMLHLLGLVRFDDLSNVYFRYEADRTWMLYLLAGLFGPIALAQGYRRVLPLLRQYVRDTATQALAKEAS